ncbi:bifunctional biotin--[acetyl-CoA-carboxylase] ligase/biotin operon repressor BirA [Streptococcus pacificus]|uniref:Bifunctional ligase/repressor BirA n=1 Tax=Streptococcus pacificus TaxID=2740577 RepID=A0ABS0ZIU4_9STRE|nr:bifunctional biotin--[acetyl-CoA-carboxylase] ligase/biotin operon repressor BirA [Streptococcus pacificus]MBJ8325939.1 bifunctional biotin--[acetyl-CoA-carboxylase] ligase/biotin operon repressor BirA [Streptococcus pacificus]
MKTHEKIFCHLYESEDFVTGEELGALCQLSRTAIWKSIQKLEQFDIQIQSQKKRGYRLLSGDLLIPEMIEQQTGIPVSLNNNSLSTQLDAKIAIQEGKNAPRLYLATNQKEAKGRFGRQFHAFPGGIYMSLHIQPHVATDKPPAYTMMIASAIVKAISRLTGIETQIKWVNDIYLGQKKIAGILTEAISSVETGLITDVIIGVGINFNIKELPEELDKKAASLFTKEPNITRNQLISEILNLFFKIPEADHIKVYKDKSFILDKHITFTKDGKPYQGTAIDITNNGALIVQLDNGKTKTLLGGEVILSSW